jgi:hypothetical protein
MRYLKTTLGTHTIPESEYPIALLKVREILDAHRGKLIARLITDLPIYIDYKFGVKVNARQVDEIKEKLSYLKSASVDMDKYRFIVQQMMAQETTYVNTAPFYQEIDDNISSYLNASQLKLVK